MNSLSVAGLGKLGSCLAASLASRGFCQVLGVDINPNVVNSINRKKAHIYEPGLQELLQSNSNLEATTYIERAVTETDTTIILVPTPSLQDGSFSLEYVLQVCESLGKHLKGRREYHLVVISSTVMPGSCDNEIKKKLEETSGRKVGKSLGLCYCPEFVALGNVIKGFQRPDFVMIGQSDDRAGEKLQAIYEKFCTNDPPIVKINLIEAEIAKLALNFCLTYKISVANTLTEICEKLPNANVDNVTGAIGLDSRIGPKYLKGGLGAGGECLPRDIKAMLTLADNIGAISVLPYAVQAVNQHQITRMYARLNKILGKNKVLGILGLSFKLNTNVTTESTGMALYNAYHDSIYGYKPSVGVVIEKSIRKVIVYDDLVEMGSSAICAQECVDESDIIVLTLPTDYGGLEFREGQTVIDCWRVLDRELVKSQGAKYVAIGIGE